MANDFIVTVVCDVCGGDGLRLVHEGIVVDGVMQPPGDHACPYCTAGKRTVGTVTIPQLDDIVDKCNDILDKCNDIFEKLNE